MRLPAFRSFLVATPFLLLLVLPASAQDSKGSLSEKSLDIQVPVKLEYLMYSPPNFEDQEDWPLVLFLHGAGERGDNLDLVKKHGPPKLAEQGKQLPFVMIAPQCPSGKRWEPWQLNTLLDEVLATTPRLDQNRIYVTGLSMGGYGTWALAAQSPERFAAIAPICGGGDPRTARRFSDLPTWVFHGGKDSVVPLSASEAMVESMKAAGGDPKFTIYPEAGHDSWTETYDNPDFYEWLVSQRRED
ncbi:MAG: prolyl oligopeptidase family serine peptidase [Rubripirellula sp.]